MYEGSWAATVFPPVRRGERSSATPVGSSAFRLWGIFFWVVFVSFSVLFLFPLPFGLGSSPQLTWANIH